MTVQGKLIGDSLSVNGLGVAEFNAGTNIVLRAGNKIDYIINDVILGTINSDGSNLAVINTTVDNTPIGSTTASTAAFTTGTVASQPTTANGISNKKYVDNTSTALAIALGV
jgi:phosphoglycerol transferase MdoB-like AlkP superfamily enzyme